MLEVYNNGNYSAEVLSSV